MVKKTKTVGCFLEYEDKFIILHRVPHESQPNTWGLVAGTPDKDEEDAQAMLREIEEETSYKPKKDELKLLGSWTWHFPEKSVEFVTFRIKLKDKIKIKLDPNEHKDYRWVTAEECYARKDLIHGFHDLLKLVGYIKNG